MFRFAYFRDLIEYRDVVGQLVKQYLTMRYKRTFLGFLWTLVTPLLTMTVMAMVFSQLMRFGVEDFAVYLFSGLVPWWVFANGVMNSGNALLSNEAIIKKIYIPKQVFPTASLMGVVVDSVFSTAALFIIMLFLGVVPTAALSILPLSFFLLVIFVYGIVLLQSILVVYFRDMAHVVPILIQTLFYLTPILYPLSVIPEQYAYLMDLNPMYHFVELFHKPIYDGEFPGGATIVAAAILAFGSLFIGMSIFNSFSDKVIFRM